MFVFILVNKEMDQTTNLNTNKEVPIFLCDNLEINFNAFTRQQTVNPGEDVTGPIIF